MYNLTGRALQPLALRLDPDRADAGETRGDWRNHRHADAPGWEPGRLSRA